MQDQREPLKLHGWKLFIKYKTLVPTAIMSTKNVTGDKDTPDEEMINYKPGKNLLRWCKAWNRKFIGKTA